MKKREYTGVILTITAAFLWAFMGVFTRYLNSFNLFAIEIAQVRVVIGFMCVGAYLLIFNRKALKIKLRDLWCFLGTGVVSLLFFCVLYFMSLEYVTMSIAAVLLYTAPIFVMLMSIVLFKEKLTLTKLIALLLAFCGCIFTSGIIGGAKGELIGLLMALGSGFFYALYSIFSRYAINRGYSSWTIVFYTFLFASVGCAFFSDWVNIAQVFSASRTVPFLYLGLGVITGFLPYIFYSMGLERLESSRASIIASFEPVGATILGLVFFNEVPDVFCILGIVLVLSSIVILSVKKDK